MAREKRGKTITITSMKGGVGKTTTVLLLASTFKKLNKKVLIVDLDLYSGSIAFLLDANVKNSIYNICDDMRNNRYKGINGGDYICHYDELTDIIPAPKDSRQSGKVDKKCLEILLESLANYYDVVLIDTNHVLDVYSMIAFNASDYIINIFANDAMDLKGTKNFVSICKNMNVANLLLVLNEAFDDRKKYFSNFDMKNVVKHNIDYIIPDYYYIRGFDMYAMDGSLYEYFSKLLKGSKKNSQIMEKLALRLIEDSEEGVDSNEEK